ncbi:MAG TPA: glycosyltransferase [Thermoanaerobaculia bacterium]
MISVIVASYNYGHLLGEALQSVLAQTTGDWECIVVDDGSTDDTASVVARFDDSRIRSVRQENRGLAAARNRGLAEARGAYLQFLDADDRLAPEKLAVQAAFLDAHAEVDIVIGPVTFFRSEAPDVVLYSLRGHLSRPLAPRVESTSEAMRLLEHMNIMVVTAPLVRRSVLERAGAFNERLRACEDWDLWLRAARSGASFRYVDHPTSLAFVRTHETSMSRSGERMTLGLIEGSRTWEGGDPLPRVYEMAAGLAGVMEGHRLRGARRILRASRRATVLFARLRWLAYGVIALVLPRRLFWWCVTRPMPERALELLRRLKGER